MTKYVVLVGDGIGDYPLDELGGRTILEAARTPQMDELARGGLLGLAQTIPEEKGPGSDVANMSIMGYDPVRFHSGRGPLEAASMGVSLRPEELAFRMNFVTLEIQDSGVVFMRDHSAGHLSTEEGRILIDFLSEHLPLDKGQKLYPGVSYRHLLTWPDMPDGLPTIPPHDWRDQEVTAYLNSNHQGFKPLLDLIRASWPLLRDHPLNQTRIKDNLRPANSIWPWGQGRPPLLSTYPERWGLKGAVVSAVDLIKGLGVYAGLNPLDVPGATGLVDTNYEGKVQAALAALTAGDYVLVHIEAPDEAGHQGDIEQKIEAVERFDRLVVGPMRAALEKMGDFSLMILCDHYTPIALKTHTREAVPFIIYPHHRASGRPYTESEAQATGILVTPGHKLADIFLGGGRIDLGPGPDIDTPPGGCR